MAERLGISHSGYHLYERESAGSFKKQFLPMSFARRVAAVLADHGVDTDDVLALAGIGIDEASTPPLSVGEEQMLDRWRRLSPTQRRLVQSLMSELIGDDAADLPPPSIHVPARGYEAGEH